MAVPPVAAVNHPLNVWSLRVGVPGLPFIDPPVEVEPAEIALPPWVSYVTVSVFGVHWA